ncbi:phage major capsid protein [Ochrobactrum sp. 695/2009]|nr:phage major capsid protein [Brucella intermedia]PJR89960.1 phage major capsid protein [Ochrobactrum sp. 721/2009]PJT14177.1 phage major capsid protein [Ochrobactrum sp. 720/2009]PJT24346.1 phage major capsid protein [Ochrobactrum sp. 715/2009]PJT30329.1 phage major capsid protein [Ochrobactrum sp. 695/2009]PJT33856.1 phage major capsid protein [Ochrobactrum sp. 689/2009]
MSEVSLAEKIGELGQSLASIKEKVGNLATDFTTQLQQHGTVSTELTGKVDKALLELGDTTTRLGDLEKRAAREVENVAREPMDIGDIVVASDKFKATDVSGSWRGSIRVGMERADITSANTTVGAGRSAGTSLVPGHRVPGIVAPPQRLLTIRDLLAPGRTSQSSVEFVKETGFTNNAAPTAEGAQKPKSDLTFDLETTPVRTIPHIFKASRQILDDAPGLASYINARGTYGLKFVEEGQLLNGDGTGQNLHGIVPQAQAFAPAFVPEQETAIDRLRLAILQVILAEYPANGFVLNPIDWTKIELTKDLGGNYIVGNAQSPMGPSLWNLPVVQTQAIAADKFLTGAFNLAAQIFDRMDIEVLMSSENVDDFEKNMFTIRIEERLALAVYRPEAFVTGDVNPPATP